MAGKEMDYSQNETFLRAFVAFVITGVVAPSEDVPMEVLRALKDISRIKQYNWAQYGVDFIFQKAPNTIQEL